MTLVRALSSFSVLFSLSLSRQFGGSNQFLSSNKLPDILPVPGHGVLSQTGIKGRGASFLHFGGASGKGRSVAVGLGVAGLNFLGVAPFLFSAVWFFLMLGLASGSGGLN